MKSQAFNPFLPLSEYIPDGEPHVFGERVYLFGSHDRFGGAWYCLNDYLCYSAPLDDLTQWRLEGVIYRKEQDPRNQRIPAGAQRVLSPSQNEKDYEEAAMNPPGIHALWAPDVTKGPDGRYYLYYCMDVLPQIAVAVSDHPAGAYAFYGFVRHADGTVLGEGQKDLIQFDPGIFVDDDGEIYLFSGNSTRPWEGLDPRKSSQVMRLEKDMLTLKGEPSKLLPNYQQAIGTDFEGHAFFEASSIRKIHGKYYLIYSSVNSHELCYAVSDAPDKGYRFGGTVVDIGDVYLHGRTEEEAQNCLGNTHGGIERINGQWYVFYHRQTNRTQFSRQACAEKIYFDEQGRIAQAETTSCGLNAGALLAVGDYPAAIACSLTRNGKNVFSRPERMGDYYPYFTQDTKDGALPEQSPEEPTQYIANIQDGTKIGYKYFRLAGTQKLSVWARGNASGKLTLVLGEQKVSFADAKLQGNEWQKITFSFQEQEGVFPLYLIYNGEGKLDISRLSFL